jgi:hypothetical protein
MENKTNLGKELLSLGKDLAEAVRRMKSSKEFKTLEKDVTKAVKSISNSMWMSLKAAKKSPTTKKIQKRLGKVIKEGQKQGAIELDKAQKAAAKGIQKARIILKKIKSKKDSPQSIV